MAQAPRPGIDYLPDGFSDPVDQPWPLALQVVVFAALFIALQWAWSLAEGTAIERLIVAQATVTPASWWINLLTPELDVKVVNFSLRAPGGGINVLNGCEGLDVLFLLWSALVVTAMGWRRRLVGLVAGTGFVWALNQVRVVVLFYANREDKELFALLHGTVAPLLLIVATTAVFVLLLAWPQRAARLADVSKPTATHA
jgi:exosortase/archaeosortase family protein